MCPSGAMLNIRKLFVPKKFLVPHSVGSNTYTLRPLTTNDMENDYDAVMSSRESLRHVFYEYDTKWPTDDMSIEDNYRDLKHHQEDFEQRSGFTYTIGLMAPVVLGVSISTHLIEASMTPRCIIGCVTARSHRGWKRRSGRFCDSGCWTCGLFGIQPFRGGMCHGGFGRLCQRRVC